MLSLTCHRPLVSADSGFIMVFRQAIQSNKLLRWMHGYMDAGEGKGGGKRSGVRGGVGLSKKVG